jgi:hypothetical protein
MVTIFFIFVTTAFFGIIAANAAEAVARAAATV